MTGGIIIRGSADSRIECVGGDVCGAVCSSVGLGGTRAVTGKECAKPHGRRAWGGCQGCGGWWGVVSARGMVGFGSICGVD